MANLPNMNLLSKTNSFAVLYEMRPWPVKKIVGKTECIYDSSNPRFVSNFTLDYFFEETQQFVVDCYNMENENFKNDLSK